MSRPHIGNSDDVWWTREGTSADYWRPVCHEIRPHSQASVEFSGAFGTHVYRVEDKEATMSNRIKAVLLEANRQGIAPEDAELLVDIIEECEWDELLAVIVVKLVREYPEILDSWKE